MATETGFLVRTVTFGDTAYLYQVYLPPDYTSYQSWPVILFLHGAGERGDDGLIQTKVGIGNAIRQYRDRFPCLVVLPQCRPELGWTGAMEEQALQALEETVHDFNGDRKRIYLTGLSLGGCGTWAIALHHPGRFAAIVPVCGWIAVPNTDMTLENAGFFGRLNPYATHAEPFTAAAEQLGDTPAWVFHGDADEVVTVEESRRMVAAMEAGAGNVRYTEYPEVGHNSWDNAYAEPDLMPWLLAWKS
ncbi:MAG: prolyl oligopeptidase family serine peptidase [Gemmatimonadota bacterium]|nr:prolyl oligopeptidase family serine peptidase [Gemmatimonadota bacterium]